jgi:hypothetical protein
MNLNYCDDSCPKSHSFEELPIIGCIDGNCCEEYKYKTCPFLHPNDKIMTKEEYFKRMYEFVAPYEVNKKIVCKYIEVGCRINGCTKAHTVKELEITKCNCYRKSCPFLHERDENMSREEYFKRMINFVQPANMFNKNMLCRYIDIGCRINNCPYSHNIDELIMHKCTNVNCKLSRCMFLHNDEVIKKSEYFTRIYKFTETLKIGTVVCQDKYCKDRKCKYAHSLNEFVVSNCVRENRCKKSSCPFKHPGENLEKYEFYKRMQRSFYPN